MTGEWYVKSSREQPDLSFLEYEEPRLVGPMSAATVRALALSGGLAPDAKVVMEGTDVEFTVDAFLAGVPANPLPEWLTDVAGGSSVLQSRAPGAEVWLEDIRQIEQSLRNLPAPAPPAAEAPPTAPAPSPAALELGYDPDTGLIVDPVTDTRRQRDEAKRRKEEVGQQATVSISEVFLAAQRAIQEWVDADANAPLVIGGDPEAVRSCPSVLELMRRYEGYGSVMREKLWKRLFFLIENRRQYSRATR